MYSFSYLEPICYWMSSSNCCFLTCIQISQEASQVVWYSHLFKTFPEFVVIHTVKGFNLVNEAEVDVSLEFSWFYLIQWILAICSGSSTFSKSSLSIWKLLVHILLKPCLNDFEHYSLKWVQLSSSLNTLWHCHSLGLEWKLTFSCPVPLLSFPNFLSYWVQNLHSVIF